MPIPPTLLSREHEMTEAVLETSLNCDVMLSMRINWLEKRKRIKGDIAMSRKEQRREEKEPYRV